MCTGNKNQIVLLIINFFSKIAFLPLPNPIHHWNGLHLQKDINLHVLEKWRPSKGEAAYKVLEAVPCMLILTLKPSSWPPALQQQCCFQIFWRSPSTWTYWKQLCCCWGWDTCGWNTVCLQQWYASELGLALGRSLCSCLVCHLSSPRVHCFLHVSCSVLSILFETLPGFMISFGRCCCCQMLDF